MDIIKLIKDDARHPDYNRVVKLKDDYFSWVTGIGLDSRLKRFVKRENEHEFAQRVNLTNHIIPSSLRRIMTTFQKGLRSNAISLVWGYSNERKKEELSGVLEAFNGEDNPEEYLKRVFINKSFIEPNGWLVVEFQSTDGNELANPYPFEVPTEQALDFKFNNGILDYLFIYTPSKVVSKGKTIEAKRYTLYQSDRAIVAEQVSPDGIEALLPSAWVVYDFDGVKYFRSDKKGIVFQLIEPEPYNLLPPVAVRWGYIHDVSTDQRTFESAIESARPYIEKSLKAVSEFDLGVTLHAFPQKFQYAPRCSSPNCNGGSDIQTGGACGHCKGTGFEPVHTSGQDIITLAMPKSIDDTFQLSNLIHYAALPIEVLNFQREQVDRLSVEINKSVFNADVFSRAQVAETATEQVINLQAVYDTLYPFAKHYARLWKYIVEQSAEITSLYDGLVVSAIVSDDFKLKTTEELYDELKKAIDTNAGAETIAAIKYDIAQVKYKDSPTDMKRYDTLVYFEPLAGKTEQEKIAITSSLPTNNPTRVLYSFYLDIFKAIELEMGVGFYDLTPQKQKAKIDEVIKQFTPTTTVTTF